MGVKIDAAAYSSIGGRLNNEDNFYLNGLFLKREAMDRGGQVSVRETKAKQIYGVFDGMGGAEHGEYASSYAAQALQHYQKTVRAVDAPDELQKFLTNVSKSISGFSVSNGLRSGACGCTAAILILKGNHYRTVHVGDSRIYLLRESHLVRLTKDQSEVQRLLDAGLITPEEARSHPRKNVITHHLGMNLKGGELQAVISEPAEIYTGDCFLLCSDGVSDILRDAEMEQVFNPESSAHENAGRIVRMAEQCSNEKGIRADNITAIVLRAMKAVDRGKESRP